MTEILFARKTDVDSLIISIAAANGAVRFDVAQTLTGPQQTQALANVAGAPLASPAFTGTVSVTSTAQIIVGNATAVNLSAGLTPSLQNHSLANTAIASFRWSNDAGGSQLVNAKSRGATVGTHTAVQSGDTLANNQYYASDGTGFILAGAIRCEADAAPATNSMFGRILFLTNQGTTAVTEAMRVTSTGGVNIGAFSADPGQGNLRVQNTVTIANTTVSNGASIISASKNWTGVSATNLMATFTAYNDQSRFVIQRANGTAASTTATIAGDLIGQLGFRGYFVTGGPGFSNTQATIAATAIDTYTSTTQGTQLDVFTTASGTTTLANVVRFQGSGGVSIGSGVVATDPGQGSLLVQNTITVNNTASTTAINVVDINKDWSSGLATNILAAYTAYGDVARFAIRQSGGTRASQSAISAGTIGVLTFRGWDTAQFATSGQIAAVATETFSTSAHGTELRFSVIPSTTTALVEGMRLQNSTGLSIGSTAVATDPGAGNLLVQNFINSGGYTRVVSNFSVTSSAALVNVTGLSVTLIAGKTYSFQAKLYFTSNAAGGVQAAVGGTVTPSSIAYTGYTITGSNTIVGFQPANILGTAVGTITATTLGLIDISGTIVVTTGGTLTIQFAQNVSNAAASTVLAGSWFKVWQVT